MCRPTTPNVYVKTQLLIKQELQYTVGCALLYNIRKPMTSMILIFHTIKMVFKIKNGAFNYKKTLVC